MGGRGSSSISTAGKERETGSDLRNLGGAPDKREDIRKSFIDELGFADVTGTNKIPTATLNSYAIALKSLEQKYGAIANSDNPIFTTGNGSRTLAAVYWNVNNPADQFMAINTNVLGRTRSNLSTQRESESQGWTVSTNGKITKQNAAVVTHEYGHMLHNAMAAKQGVASRDFTAKAQQEITSIATSKYGAGKNTRVSEYGTKNSAEFFAEAFSSYNSGKPNAYGKAMGDWLKKNKL